MPQSIAVAIHQVTCPVCKQEFFEFEEYELIRCPHCGDSCINVEEYENKEITLYLDPLSGQVSAEVA